MMLGPAMPGERGGRDRGRRSLFSNASHHPVGQLHPGHPSIQMSIRFNGIL